MWLSRNSFRKMLQKIPWIPFHTGPDDDSFQLHTEAITSCRNTIWTDRKCFKHPQHFVIQMDTFIALLPPRSFWINISSSFSINWIHETQKNSKIQSYCKNKLIIIFKYLMWQPSNAVPNVIKWKVTEPMKISL